MISQPAAGTISRMGKKTPKPGRFKATGGRFGPGKVHLHLYHQDDKERYVACQPPGWANQPHGAPAGAVTDVTCKHCLKKM